MNDARTAQRRARLGAALRSARADAGLTQEKVALAAGLDRSFYVEVETGKHSVTIDRLLDIAEALDTTASRLLDGIT